MLPAVHAGCGGNIVTGPQSMPWAVPRVYRTYCQRCHEFVDWEVVFGGLELIDRRRQQVAPPGSLCAFWFPDQRRPEGSDGLDIMKYPAREETE